MPHRPPSLVWLTMLLVQLLLLPLARAQLIASNLPSCANSCAVLQQAQGSCESNPSTAQSCFCQSALLSSIKTTSNNICAPTCSDSDWATIEAWYKSTCANGGTEPTTTTAANGATAAAGAAAAAATTTAPASSSEGSDINENQSGPEWWNAHWQWVVMLIVLVIGFTAIGVGGRLWYRRRHKKVDGEIVETAPQPQPPDMGMWAPSRHSVHDFTNGGASRERPESTVAPLPTRQMTAGKGKYREGTRPPIPGRTPSQRLKKAMESVQM